MKKKYSIFYELVPRRYFNGILGALVLIAAWGAFSTWREFEALRAGQEEVSAGIAAVGQGLEDIGRRIDRLAEALGMAPVENGLASFYNYPFHGRMTANGEIYDKDSQTAAHKTARFGTWALVENLLNGAKTMVRINDRGPFIEGRILDLSEKGARDLGMIDLGVVPIRIRWITRDMLIARPGDQN